MFELVKPALPYLESYTHALAQGWSPNNLRPETAQDELVEIAQDPYAFIKKITDLHVPDGATITLTDGSKVPRLPGFRRWIWDKEFCGNVNFRFQRGTTALPSYCLGHVGYGTVPWKQRLGYATQALAIFLEEIKPLGLEYVELTTEPENIPSQKVITRNGGFLVETFKCHPAYGDYIKQRYRINL
ncbi:MAG: GNAT family N-acetyltransferase [Alphaproteobacteria bacterium]|nr:GNAT family N-acetyltransferase [Alphaproteobacteria bacterium]